MNVRIIRYRDQETSDFEKFVPDSTHVTSPYCIEEGTAFYLKADVANSGVRKSGRHFNFEIESLSCSSCC